MSNIVNKFNTLLRIILKDNTLIEHFKNALVEDEQYSLASELRCAQKALNPSTISTNEFRIGNLVADNLNEYEITEIYSNFIRAEKSNIVYSLSNVTPVKLTTEWLRRFDFDADEIMWKKTTVSIGDYSGELWLIHNFNLDRRIVEIKWVHQLQNLYFLLAREELNL